jgi:hypothetical protein
MWRGFEKKMDPRVKPEDDSVWGWGGDEEKRLSLQIRYIPSFDDA